MTTDLSCWSQNSFTQQGDYIVLWICRARPDHATYLLLTRPAAPETVAQRRMMLRTRPSHPCLGLPCMRRRRVPGLCGVVPRSDKRERAPAAHAPHPSFAAQFLLLAALACSAFPPVHELAPFCAHPSSPSPWHCSAQVVAETRIGREGRTAARNTVEALEALARSVMAFARDAAQRRRSGGAGCVARRRGARAGCCAIAWAAEYLCTPMTRLTAHLLTTHYSLLTAHHHHSLLTTCTHSARPATCTPRFAAGGRQNQQIKLHQAWVDRVRGYSASQENDS
mgnify:CR=1 FL=1